MRKVIIPIAVAVALLLGTQVSPALGSTPSWNPQAQEVNLPPGADPVYPFAELRSVSCGAAGSCSAVGSYDEPGLEHEAMVVSQVGGAWETAEKVSLPLGDEDPYLHSISCSSAGNCTAVGQVNIGSESEGLVVSQVNGAWGASQAIHGPAGATWTWLGSVNCAEDGGCTAVGGYEDSSGQEHAMAVSESAGIWAAATEIQLPVGASLSSDASVNNVSCPAANACVALGTFSESPGHYKTMVASQSAGIWGIAKEIAAPSGSLSFSASGISCGAVGSCTVGGSYEEAGGIHHPAVADEAEGTWGEVAPLTMPPSFSTNKSSPEVEAVSCTGEGTCTAVGHYVDDTEAEKAFSAKETSGTWATAEQVSVPGTPEPEFPYHIVGFRALDCVTAESCGAIGFGYFRGVTFLMEGGSWGTGGSSIMLPSNSQSEESGDLESLSCGGVGSCSAVGSYGDTEGMERAMVLSTEGAALAQHTLAVAKSGNGSGSVTSSPAGINCGSTCSHAFDEGITVTLTATPTGGSNFTGWSGSGCSGTGTCHVTMNADKGVTATFSGEEAPAAGGTGPSTPPAPQPPPPIVGNQNAAAYGKCVSAAAKTFKKAEKVAKQKDGKARANAVHAAQKNKKKAMSDCRSRFG